jgi:drug/metabolite transporter (DMT)-like permease
MLMRCFTRECPTRRLCVWVFLDVAGASMLTTHSFVQFLFREDPPPTVFPVQLNHFQALLLFAAIISVAFGFVSRRQPLARLKYILWSLFLFLLIGISIGWAMYPFSR